MTKEINTLEEAANHKQVVHVDIKGRAIYVRPYGNCSVMNGLYEGNLRLGNVAVSDDGNLKVNLR